MVRLLKCLQHWVRQGALRLLNPFGLRGIAFSSELAVPESEMRDVYRLRAHASQDLLIH